MLLRTISLSLALLSPAALLACGSASEGALSTARKALECQTNTDCGTGAECAVEDNGSFCKLHGDSASDAADDSNATSSSGDSGATTCASDRDCGVGYECEIEHGSSYCKAHGGGSDDGAAAAGGAGGSDDGRAGSAASGGSDDGAAVGETPGCSSDADCGAGLECEYEHGGSYCKPHGGSDDGSAGAAGDDAGVAGAAGASATPVGACTSDADCGAGLECEYEHGVSYCKAHGGGNSGKGHGGSDD